ncbi:hypothetical protein ACLOJK_024244 [Asimina triloba]
MNPNKPEADSIEIVVHSSSAGATDPKFSSTLLHLNSYQIRPDGEFLFLPLMLDRKEGERGERKNQLTAIVVMTTSSSASSSGQVPENPRIPVDLTISKKSGIPGLTSGSLSFRDAAGNLVCRLYGISSSRDAKLLKDASGNPLVHVLPHKGGGWQCFRGDSSEPKDLMFMVEKTSHSRLRTVLEVFPVDQKWGSLQPDFRVEGSPFHRSCTIYRGNFIVAQHCYHKKSTKLVLGVPFSLRFRAWGLKLCSASQPAMSLPSELGSSYPIYLAELIGFSLDCTIPCPVSRFRHCS